MTIAERIRRFFGALNSLTRILLPRDAGDYLSRGLDRHVRGDLAGAIDDYDQALAHSADDDSRAIAYLTRGNARKDRGDLAGAIADYNQALARQPGNAGAYLSRAQAYQALGETEQAIADLQIVRELTVNPGWRNEAQEQLRILKGGQP
jgi:tetratricopeptide (TPR) repeat protein